MQIANGRYRPKPMKLPYLQLWEESVEKLARESRSFYHAPYTVFDILPDDKWDPYHLSREAHLLSDNRSIKPFYVSVRGARAFSISLRHFMVMCITKTK